MDNKITFYINNKAYTINLNGDENNAIREALQKYLSVDTNINTKELLTAYIQQTYKVTMYEEKLKEIIESISEL